MEDFDLTVLEQYPIETENIRKARGAVLCETKDGLLLLKQASLSQEKADVINKIHKEMKEQYGAQSDGLFANKEGNYVSLSEDGTKYYLKKWYKGRECDVKKTAEILEAARILAKLHRIMRFPEYVGSFRMSDQKDEYRRHNRELKKVRTFIRKRTVKGEFETKFLQCFDEMYQIAVCVERALESSAYDRLKEEALENGCFIHGEYNYHNLLLTSDGMTVVNFEHTVPNIQAVDLCYFLRKVMEKHQWNSKLGAEMLRAYSAVNPLSEEEKEYIALRLSYPEKFWKCANTYYNSNKAWISSKSVEKLNVAIEQTEIKRRFLEEIFSFHLSGSSV